MEVAPLKCEFCGRELDKLHYYIKNKMICDECMTNLYSPRLILSSQGSCNSRLWNATLYRQEAFGLLISDLTRCGWFMEKKVKFKGRPRVAGFCRTIPEKFEVTYHLRYENRIKKCLRIPEDKYYYGATAHCSGGACYFHAVKEDYKRHFEDSEEDEWNPEKMYQKYLSRLAP